MGFRTIKVFKLEEYNSKTSKDGCHPQEGIVINVFLNYLGFNSVAVGYK
ncbi:hypothetical protein SAMN04487821_114114 [Enterococcus malodoratus]|nr:hypothetical protein [Enterococcus malodoratus]SET55000.1 hypothetical protein SAMN04487821_114114 [Enterococcus malodoratus]